ncbi:hypothetical protein [Prosthecobacter sp.]|uniref:hypothetical protein n=1 Tax=Prosthecobacter sp. TaxID=1965333 RepID=UPI0037847A23
MPRLIPMHALTALLASLMFLVASMHVKAEEVGWYMVLSRIRTSSIKGLIHPLNGRQSLALSDTLNWGDLQSPGGTVLLTDQNAVQIYDQMTHPVKKGDYTGFAFLSQATSGLFKISEADVGGQLMRKTLHVKEDVPSQKLGELMFFLCDHLGGNYWSLAPAVATAKEWAMLPGSSKILWPMVSRVVPGPPVPGN